MHTNKIDNIDFKAKFRYKKLKYTPKYLKRAATEFKKNTSKYPDFSLIYDGKDCYNMHHFSLRGLDGTELAASEFKLPRTLLKNNYSKDDDNIKLIKQKYVAYHLLEVFKSLISKTTK